MELVSKNSVLNKKFYIFPARTAVSSQCPSYHNVDVHVLVLFAKRPYYNYKYYSTELGAVYMREGSPR